VAELTLPDGVRLHWERAGEGPPVVLAVQFFGYPEVFAGLLSDLASDHTVVTYDLRGTGRSSRTGPYDIATDARDLGALIDATGAPAVVLGTGDGSNRGVRLAAERPDLIEAIVTPGGNPIGRIAARGTDALVESPSVLDALVGMIETDYRAALRTIIADANPQLDEEEARRRVDGVVERCPPEVGAARLRAWIADEALDESRALGDRLWILSHSSNPWFPAAALDRTRELLPEARIVSIADGPISRPDLTAAVVRAITHGRPLEDATILETSS
jgi:pimeloyl-ACP methyl ester carboxylesterase